MNKPVFYDDKFMGISLNEPGFVTRLNIQNAKLFSREKPKLESIDIELTERCNNACVHCYINLPKNDLKAKSHELSTSQWKDIIKQATELGTIIVRYTGGEPLLRDDFEELYLYARRLGLKVILFTNARLITPRLVDLFTKFPPMMKLEVSVYGMRAESYEATACAMGSYVEYQHGINLLLQKQIPFIVKSVLLPTNKNEKDEFETWATSIPWMKGPPSYSLFLDFRTRRDSAVKNRLISKMRFSPEEVLSLLSKNTKAYIKSMALFGKQFLYPPGDELFTCGAGEKPCIDAYGILQMCMLLRHPDCVYDLKKGNLRSGVLEALPQFRKIKATNPDYIRRCARCFLKGLCEQCPAKSWTEHGTLDTPVEYLCQVAHAQACFLGLVKENENAWEIEDWRNRIDGLVERSCSLK